MSTASQPTVLVIEDDREMQAVLRDVLGRDGYRVVAASTGQRALEVARVEQPDAVILDKELPDASGLDLIPLLRRRSPDTPIILITAFGGAAAAAEAFRREATRYLEKPFPVQELLGILRTLTRPPSDDPVA
jgi:two-component system response regulator AtoC